MNDVLTDRSLKNVEKMAKLVEDSRIVNGTFGEFIIPSIKSTMAEVVDSELAQEGKDELKILEAIHKGTLVSKAKK